MRILSIGNFGRGWDGSICDEEHIAKALEDLGHEVIREQREKIVAGYELLNGCDFVLIAQWDGYPIHFTDKLRSTQQGPIIYWAFDYQADGQEWHERLVKHSDLYLSKRLADSKYPNWRWLSQDFAPQFLDKYVGDVDQDIDVLFTGSYLPWATERNETLKQIDDAFDLTIHSFTPDAWKAQGFKRVFGPAMDHDLPRLIARSKVNLAIDHTIEAGYWSDRASQVMCCGGFVLHRYVPMMESAFRSHITYYFYQSDAVDAVRYWLEHDEGREMIAAQAYEYSPMYKVKERVADMLNIVRSIL